MENSVIESSVIENTTTDQNKVMQEESLEQNIYINRELSLLSFQYRVLELAKDVTIPLLNRLRFLCISSSNLDEFFEVRVSGLKRHELMGMPIQGPDYPDQTPVSEQLKQIREIAHMLVDDQYRVLNETLIPAMEEEGIYITRRTKWNKKQSDWVKEYFEDQLFPILTPIALDPAHPFPRVLNKSLNFIVSLKGKDAFGRSSELAVVQAPRALPRIIPLPEGIANHPHDFIFLSSVIHAHIDSIFPGMEVTGCYQFRVTRNSDLFLDHTKMDDLLHAVEGELFSRRYGDSVRLEIVNSCPEKLCNFLLKEFKLGEDDLYLVNGPVNLNRMENIIDLVDLPHLEYPKHNQVIPVNLKRNTNVFEALAKKDALIHLPFESFSPIIDMLQQASVDPNVVAIKQTLYRTGSDSMLVDILVNAARAGKEVTVIIELRARFDEAANIHLATYLQEAGAHVVYGVVGFKTHAKMMLITRREKGKIKNYAHLSTGNYHATTARHYTDIGLLTSDKKITQDVHKLFLQMTGMSKKSDLSTIIQSPFNLHQSILDFIEVEIKNALEGKSARIILKTNALTHKDIVDALYRASQAGVQIYLIIRSICTLRPGITGLSENIKVRSVLGRFLEHTRIYFFENDGDQRVWLSSADLMVRNLFHRIEASFPINDPTLKRRVIEEGLEPYISCERDAWDLQQDSSFARSVEAGDFTYQSAQQFLMELHQP
ncbi:MAG: polyphosphate kinase 1 [Gammaproteobacteria bacterium]|nr:MAG: polyphosphate kinase 1 [Gammaproteobacteria bacterium]